MIIWVGLIIYFFIINLIVNKLKIKNKKIAFLVLAGLGTIFVMGTRSSTLGTGDVKTYYDYYKYIINIPFDNLVNRNIYGFEIGYVYLNKFFSIFFTNPQAILYIEASICVICVSIFIYNNSNKVFDSFIYFICLGSFMFALSGFRQAIAMSICLLSIEFVKRKKIVPFIGVIILASLIHKTAYIFIFSYFIINNEFNVKNIVVTMVISILALMFQNQLISIGNQVFDRNYSIQYTRDNV